MLLYWLAFFIISFVFIYLIKKFFSANVSLLFAMIKSKKAVDKINKAKVKKFFPIIAKIALLFGFAYLSSKLYIKKKYLRYVFLLDFFLLSFIFFISLGKTYTYSLIMSFIFAFTGLSGIAFALLFEQSALLFSQLLNGFSSCVGVAPVLPGVKIPKVPLQIPFVQGWIALLFAVFFHELSHAMMMAYYKVKLKSFGPIFFGIIPIGAFVEPDEKKLKSLPNKKRYEIFSAGPGINLFFALLFFIIFLLLSLSFSSVLESYYSKNSYLLVKTTELAGVCGFGGKSVNSDKIKEYSTVLAINNKEVHTVSDFKKEFFNARNNKKNYLIFKIKDNKNKISFKKLYFNEKGFLGVEIKQESKVKEAIYIKIINFLISLFYWLFLINIMLALFNFIPVVPFDGGNIAYGLFSGILFFVNKEKREKYLKIFFISLFLILIFLNILPAFF